jgi:hypothetical protein
VAGSLDAAGLTGGGGGGTVEFLMRPVPPTDDDREALPWIAILLAALAAVMLLFGRPRRVR